MADYITVADVDALLGAGWAGTGDEARAVLMANTWLTAKPLPAFSAVPDAVIQAGAEIAREAANGALYAEAEKGVLSKSVGADGVTVSRSYSSTARKVTAGESFAMALLAPYLGSTHEIKLVRG